MSRGVLRESFTNKSFNRSDSYKDSIELEPSSKKNKSSINSDVYTVNEKSLSNEIKMMHEFIEYKYFKKVMKQNNNIFE